MFKYYLLFMKALFDLICILYVMYRHDTVKKD